MTLLKVSGVPKPTRHWQGQIRGLLHVAVLRLCLTMKAISANTGEHSNVYKAPGLPCVETVHDQGSKAAALSQHIGSNAYMLYTGHGLAYHSKLAYLKHSELDVQHFS